MIYDLPNELDVDMLYNLEYHGMLDMVFIGCFEAQIHNDQCLLLDTIVAYEESFDDTPGLSEAELGRLVEAMHKNIQEILWSIKYYADPLKEYEDSFEDRSVNIENVMVRLDDRSFILVLEIDDGCSF